MPDSMTIKLRHADVEQEVTLLCETWNMDLYDAYPGPCCEAHPCPAHRLLAHIEAQDQELTDLRAEMRVLRGEMENYRKAYWAYEPRPRKDP